MYRLLHLLLLSSLSGLGQTPANTIKANIENKRTAAHINIPGTRLYIIPPPDFKFATSFIGLNKGDQAAINVYDLVGGNFYTNAAEFSRSAFLYRGVTVLDFRELTVNGYPAKYAVLQGDPTAKSFNLVFGDSTFSTAIMAICPADDKITAADIVKSLTSIWYDKTKVVDPFATAFFTLDTKSSKFKFAKSGANSYLYTIGGKDNGDDQNLPTVMIMQMPRDNSATLKSVVDAILERSRQYGMTNAETRYASTLTINGCDAYETEVEEVIKGVKSDDYYCVLSSGDKAILFVGMAKTDVEGNLQEFKKLAKNLKFK